MSLLFRLVRFVITLALFLVVVVAGFILWASSGRGPDDATMESPLLVVPGIAQIPPSENPTSLRVASWNIAYGRGPAGDSSGPWTRAHVEQHLNGIAAAIGASGAEVAALQEVDLAAARSHGIDEAKYVAEKLGWPYYGCVVTWQNNYVPFPYWPVSRHYGAMKSGQCVLSRYPLKSNTRYRLPQPAAQPWWYNLFYLHRAIQRVDVDLGRRVVPVYNVHLEAFDTANRIGQAEQLVELLDDNETGGALVLGDFNAVPPGAGKKHDFSDEPEMDFRHDVTISVVQKAGLRDVSGPDAAEPAFFTFPADAPTRRLDYIFLGAELTSKDSAVLPEPGAWSDHKGLVTTVGWN